MKKVSLLSALVWLASASMAQATGMVPDSSVVLVNVADGEGTITVKNTDDRPRLLYTSMYDLPEDNAHLLVVTPPVARVEAGQSQLVRFIVDSKEPIATERMKRVVFEGIPEAEKGKNQVSITLRQDLPVVIHPANLPRKNDPWTLLQWTRDGDKLVVTNPSPYVVRMTQLLQLLPGKQTLDLPKPYVLPGATLTIDASKVKDALGSTTQLRISPASLYGYAVDSYDAPLLSKPAAVAPAASAPAAVQKAG
ncbi:fimbria/pilus chaperone family protein [Paludibacterium sp. B53371]|uniref:fimbria/pilus chaperone family protein n=1 Tax=Paludibacterium sp. B53371 TaxID=2806263 RepID=UPI001C05A4D4|nr:fimbria/pilus chaperone family protein [Paludibacterium sp. B53371]